MAVIDKVFRAFDVRGIYGEEITEDLAWKIGHASGQFLRSLLTGYERGQASSNRLVVGRDMRPQSQTLTVAMIDGITSAGIGCADIGTVDTPMVYFAINHLSACGGVQVTASHSPAECCGFKIAGARARPVVENTGLKEIKHIVSTLRRMPAGASLAAVQSLDLWGEYRRHVLRFLKVPRPLKVVVDASNGMGAKALPTVLAGTNVQVIPLHFDLAAGLVHPPDAPLEASLEALRSAVLQHGADAGICTDGDADRCVFVDEKGLLVRGDLMTALLARLFLRDNPGGTVVYDLRSSRATPEEIRAAGGIPRRERVGHALMKKAMSDGHGILGGDLGGRFYFRDNYNCDSAVIALASAATVMAASDRPLSELIAPLRRYAYTGEMLFPVSHADAKLREIAEALKDAQVDQLDGLTYQYDDWWINLRTPRSEPVILVTMEARNPELLNEKLNLVKSILGDPWRN
jgi:phosphomannomutase